MGPCLITVSLAVALCEALRTNSCAIHGVLPVGLVSVKCPQEPFLVLLESHYGWLWFVWLASQWWIVAHIWWPVPERKKTNQYATQIILV